MDIFGTAKTVGAVDDKAIAAGLVADSTAAIQGLGAAVATTTNPDLKLLFGEFSHQATVGQSSAATYMADRGWAKPTANSDEQLRMALGDADDIIAQHL